MPRDLVTTIETVGGGRDAPADEFVLSIQSMRSLRRWIQDALNELNEKHDDDGWRYLSTHDLRRTWATPLSDVEVDPLLVLDWGGWEDLETFWTITKRSSRLPRNGGLVRR
ncbi:tyrosine-type recombinase/integrase [Halorubrum laminariae]|uniref:Tyrosine-type recombinase/integrase n=1 Tax=Halorubrum laminariae TaxID=1433523 RepID=A0ABD6C3J4_9EURY|nr:tyrosine-type recombinase/integrase [Halorubrum laminariae]